MAAAYALSRNHLVTLIESEPRLGGHARTIVSGRRGDQPVDTGFIVFNKVNYPNLLRMFDDLDVPVAPSNMSFSASFGDGKLEYSTQTADTMFAQRRNLLNPRFLGMVRDIVRFSDAMLNDAESSPLSLGDFLDEIGMGQAFRHKYLGPISGAIWSTPSHDVMDFPVAAMARFFRNHNLTFDSKEHDWFTVDGGSVAYVGRLQAHLEKAGVDIRLAAPVQGIRRTDTGAELRCTNGEWEPFDDVIMATHADITLSLLSDPSEEEHAHLSRVRYQPNTAITHHDTRLMPRRRKVWASWNYAEPDGTAPDRIGLTYWMNRLQNIPEDDPIFVTLNPQVDIDPAKIYDTADFTHPVYDLAMMDAVDHIRDLNGTRSTWFCGAWMHNGFHEDGFRSALDVVDRIERRDSIAVAAE